MSMSTRKLTKQQRKNLDEMQNLLSALEPWYRRDNVPARSDTERLFRAFYLVDNPEYIECKIAQIMRDHDDTQARVSAIHALGADIRYILETYVDAAYGNEEYQGFIGSTDRFEQADEKITDLCLELELESITRQLQKKLEYACTEGYLRNGEVTIGAVVEDSVSVVYLSDGLLEEDIDTKVLPKLQWLPGYVPRSLTATLYYDNTTLISSALEVSVRVGEKIKV